MLSPENKNMIKLIISIFVLMMPGFVTIGQPSASETAVFFTTNKLPDGSIIKIEAMSFGIIHQIPSSYGQWEFFKSASPTLMFTTSRKDPADHYLGDLWTKAEALGPSNSWYPLRRRIKPRPVKEGLEDEPLIYEGTAPHQMWETWEFPDCPEPGPWLQVRVRLTSDSTNNASVCFKLPNSETWRKQIAKEEISHFHPNEWLNGELWSAALEGDAAYAKDLIAQGADPNSCDSSGMSALGIACQDGRVEVVNFLLAHGADVNAHSKGKTVDRTALMAAVSNDGHSAMVRLLVEQGADVNTRGELGWSALIWAAREGDIENVKYLLSKKADPDIKAQDGKSVIELTEKTDGANRFEIIKILKNAQAAH